MSICRQLFILILCTEAFTHGIFAKTACDRDLYRAAAEMAATEREVHGLGPTAEPDPKGVFQAKWFLSRSALAVKGWMGRRLYRPALMAGHHALDEGGEIFRHYLSGHQMDSRSYHWSVIEKLHYKGGFTGSFGHSVFNNDVHIMSPLIYPDAFVQNVRTQIREVGHDLEIEGGERIPISKVRYSPMVGISGMSYPQLSAPSLISLLLIQVQMAKQGVYYTYNTGEGGAGFHFAILDGDRDRLKRGIMRWAARAKLFEVGSHQHASIMAYVDYIMDLRDEVFRDVAPEDIAKAQIVAQFGTAMNGVKNDEDARIDFALVEQIGKHPNVVMIQYKLKQAAKRGARVEANKVNPLVAAIRRMHLGSRSQAPAVHPSLSNYESIAKLLMATKITTQKPVSLKFGIGSVKDTYEFLKYLAEHGALPDHIQIDGADDYFSPGSGNAMPYGDSSLPSDEATIVVDAILKKLRVRDRVFVESTGGILLPQRAIEKLALGADGVAAGRLWMGMGLGCSAVRKCKDGTCPYGIASRSSAMVTTAMDPKVVAKRGLVAAEHWFSNYTLWFGEAGIADWREFRSVAGLQVPESPLRKQVGDQRVMLRNTYSMDRMKDLFGNVLSESEILELVFGGIPPLPIASPRSISLPVLRGG